MQTRRHSKALLAGVLLLGTLMQLSVSRADPPEGYGFTRYDEGLKAAANSGRQIFVYFGRYGCGYCDRTNRETFSDPQVRRRYTDHYELVYVNAEGGERLTLPDGEQITEMQLGERMNTVGTPVFLWLEPDGSKIARVYGFRSVRQLLDIDSYVQDRLYQQTSLREFLGSRS